MSYSNRPPPVNGNINTWGERLNDWLVRNRSKLAYYLTGQPATEDGILLWDAANSRILVSSNNAWVEVGGGGGGGSITNYLRDDADDTTSFRLTMGGLTVDTNTLYVDSVNNAVGIGTTDPSEKLEVVGNVEATEFIGDLRGAVVFKAKAGEALAIGDVVYISGIDGNTTVVNKADADDATKMPAFGLAANSVSNNANVEIYTFGTLAGVDTSSYTEGDELFVGTTAGALVSTAPTGEGSLVQKIGKVTRSHGSAGSIKIMGAGRTNATPNLNNGNFFLGDSNNQAVTISFATAVAAAETSHTNVLVDGDFASAGLMKRDATSGSYSIVTDNSGNWNTAYDWDDHSTQGYLTAHQDISGKADLSGATFTGSITAPNVDISTSGTVTTNIATGTGVSGNTKTVNIATGYSTGGTTTVNIAPTSSTTTKQINLNGNVSVDGDITVTGTVDGVDVGELKYSDTKYFSLRDGYTEHLSTTYKNIPLYNYIFDKATPVATVRILDLTAEVNWLDTIYNGSEYQNDLQVQCTLVVPSGTTNAVSLGSVTPTSGGGYVVGSSFHGWYFVSGDVTHYFNDFGRIHENSSGGSFERTLYAYQYDIDQDRTYFSISTYPSGYSTGTTLYWHPYAWESAGTLLNDFRYADEKGRSGQEPLNFRWKVAYDDRALKYQLKIKELSASSTQPDRGQIGQSMLKITRQEP